MTEKQYQYFIDNLNSYLGYHLVETLRNDHSNDQNPHSFTGPLLNQYDPIPNSTVVPIKDNSLANLIDKIIASDIIIYELDSVDLDQLQLIIKTLQYRKYQSKKKLIIISSIMTYSNSANNLVHDDRNYSSKKANAKYQQYVNIENICLNTPKCMVNPNLEIKVIISGIQYGLGENINGILYSKFRESYTQEKEYQKIMNNGNNVIPMVHILDLCNFIKYVIEHHQDQQYFICVDDSKCQQNSIIQKISEVMGNGKTKNVCNLEALMENNHDIWTLDLQINRSTCFDTIQVEKKVVKKYVDDFGLEKTEESYQTEDVSYIQKYKTGFIENIEQIAQEFMKYRSLKANKIFVNGPPSIGKTELSQKLAEKLGVIHLQVKEIIDEIMQEQSEFAENVRNEFKEMHLKNIEDQRVQFEEMKKKKKPKKGEEVQEFDENQVQTRMDDQMLSRIYKRRLNQNDCKLKGYILDGFPYSQGSLKKLFYDQIEIEQEKEEGEEEKEKQYKTVMNQEIWPDFVFLLDKNIELLKEQVSKLDPEIKENSHHNEEQFQRRMAVYKERFVGGINEIKDQMGDNQQTQVINMDQMEIEGLKNLVLQTINDEEFDEQLNRQLKEQHAIQQQKEQEKHEQNQFLEELEQKKKEEEEEYQQQEQIRKQEKNILDIKSQPIRQYMADLVIPSLTQILIDIGSQQPENPIEYLANQLYKKADDLDERIIKRL